MTTVSNSANMTVAERLAQRLKDSEMGSLLDEDSVTEIAGQAIKKAFFEPRTETRNYNTITLQPLAMEMAQQAFKEAMEEAIKPVVADLIKDEDFNIMIRDAVIKAIPERAQSIATGIVNQAMIHSGQVIMDRLQNTVGAKLGIVV